ncbi:MAG TPA: hypothetical protein VFC07_06805 [Verrucomicrobiae bacterium]|nr:hypothetical protein [Verrucomicrobiae bacterium]
MNKGAQPQQPKAAGLDEIDVATAQTDIPATYFAGTRKLNVSWFMYPEIDHAVATPTPGGKGK